MKVSGSVTGGDILAQKIEDYGRQLESRKFRSTLSRAASQSMLPVVKEARRLAEAQFDSPSRESVKGIKRRVLKKGERQRANIDFGALVYFSEDAYKLQFWERGFIRYGRHYAARPMLRPALESEQGAVLRRFIERVGRIMQREAEKLAVKKAVKR